MSERTLFRLRLHLNQLQRTRQSLAVITSKTSPFKYRSPNSHQAITSIHTTSYNAIDDSPPMVRYLPTTKPEDHLDDTDKTSFNLDDVPTGIPLSEMLPTSRKMPTHSLPDPTQTASQVRLWDERLRRLRVQEQRALYIALRLLKGLEKDLDNNLLPALSSAVPTSVQFDDKSIPAYHINSAIRLESSARSQANHLRSELDTLRTHFQDLIHEPPPETPYTGWAKEWLDADARMTAEERTFKIDETRAEEHRLRTKLEEVFQRQHALIHGHTTGLTRRQRLVQQDIRQRAAEWESAKPLPEKGSMMRPAEEGETKDEQTEDTPPPPSAVVPAPREGLIRRGPHAPNRARPDAATASSEDGRGGESGNIPAVVHALGADAAAERDRDAAREALVRNYIRPHGYATDAAAAASTEKGMGVESSAVTIGPHSSGADLLEQNSGAAALQEAAAAAAGESATGKADEGEDMREAGFQRSERDRRVERALREGPRSAMRRNRREKLVVRTWRRNEVGAGATAPWTDGRERESGSGHIMAGTRSLGDADVVKQKVSGKEEEEDVGSRLRAVGAAPADAAAGEGQKRPGSDDFTAEARSQGADLAEQNASAVVDKAAGERPAAAEESVAPSRRPMMSLLQRMIWLEEKTPPKK